MRTNPFFYDDGGVVARLPNGTSTWDYTEYNEDCRELSFVNAGSGDSVMVGLSDDLLSVVRSQTQDIGDNWTNLETISTHTSDLGDGLFCASVSPETIGGYGLAYQQHFATCGAVYLEQVKIIEYLVNRIQHHRIQQRG